MKYRDRQIRSIAELVSALRDRNQGKPLWFRGQSNTKWNLIPQLGRTTAGPSAEIALMKRFKQNALPHVPKAELHEWDWLILMQHYRLPTRLLDWSESPLVGLYFAVDENQDEDGALWCLLPVELNSKARIKYPNSLEIPAFEHDEILQNYLPSRVAGEQKSDMLPVGFLAGRNNPRISAQQGTFTIHHRSFNGIEEIDDKKHIWRLVIPAEFKKKMRDELYLLGYSRLTLFPELDEVAAEARRRAHDGAD